MRRAHGDCETRDAILPSIGTNTLTPDSAIAFRTSIVRWGVRSLRGWMRSSRGGKNQRRFMIAPYPMWGRSCGVRLAAGLGGLVGLVSRHRSPPTANYA